MKWSVNTALLLSCLIATCACADQQQGQQAAPVDAQTLWTQTLSPYVGSGAAVQSNLVQPMVAGTPVISIDGLNSTTSNMISSANKPPIMQIQAFSVPATGDVCYVKVSQDLAAAGVLGTISQFPAAPNCAAGGMVISGLCANGYISCPAGTFYAGPPAVNQCQFYAWGADPVTGQINTTQLAGIGTLQACYCFNSACTTVNNAAVMNIDALTGDIMSGIVSAFTAATNYAITNVESPGSGSVTIWGTKPANAAAANVNVNAAAGQAYAYASPGVADTSTTYPYADPNTLTATDATSYAAGSNGFSGMASSVLASQQAIPNSLYNIVMATSQGAATTTSSCTNIRQVVQQWNQTITPWSPPMTLDNNPVMNAWVASFMFWVSSLGYFFGPPAPPVMNWSAVLNQTDPDTWVFGVSSPGDPFNAKLNTTGADVATFVPVAPASIDPNAVGAPVITGVEVYFEILALWQPDPNDLNAEPGQYTGYSSVADMVTATSVNTPVSQLVYGPNGLLLTTIITHFYMGFIGNQAPTSLSTILKFRTTYSQQSITNTSIVGPGVGAPSCAAFEANPNCQIETETWDGRPYIANFLPTGFQMGQVAKQLPGPLGTGTTVPVYADWWEDDKTYVCTNPGNAPVYNFNPILNTAEGVINSASMSDATTFTYSNAGSTYSYQTLAQGVIPSCGQACKVKSQVVQAKVLNTAQNVSSIQSAQGQANDLLNVAYRACTTMDGNTFTCPINAAAGETIITDCSCSSDFGDVVAATAAVNAAQDAICSSD
jgi:hypothetical protein